MHYYEASTIFWHSKIPLKVVAAVREKALCAETQRVSHERAPQQGPLAPGCRPPFRVERNIPQEGICNGNICNHNSKAKWYLKMGEYTEREDKTQLHQGLRSDLDKDLQAGSELSLGWFLHHFQEGSEDPAGAAPQPRGFQASCLCLAFLTVFPGIDQVLTGSTLRVLLVHGNVRLREFQIQPRRESEGFPHDPGLLGNAQWLGGPSKEQQWIKQVFPHQHSEKQHEYFRWVGGDKSMDWGSLS